MSALSLALPPSGTRAAVTRAISARLVPIIRSSPGIGKSEIVQAIADEFNLKLNDFRLGQADITDLNGLPRFTDNGRAEFAPFNDFPLEGDALPINPKTQQPYEGWLLFFDELTSAQKQIQAAAYKVLLERKIGNHRLHERVAMVAAGNLETDNAVAYAMSTALQSRLVHLELRLDQREWIQWAIENGVDRRIIAYIGFRPNHLHNFDPAHNDRTFACPRTWWFANQLIKGREKFDEVDKSTLGGTISTGVAMEFIEFTKVFEQLPDIATIIANPQSVPVPNEPSIKYALTATLADHFDDKNVDQLIQYLTRFPVEHQIICIRMARVKKPGIMRHKSVNDLFVKLVQKM